MLSQEQYEAIVNAALATLNRHGETTLVEPGDVAARHAAHKAFDESWQTFLSVVGDLTEWSTSNA